MAEDDRRCYLRFAYMGYDAFKLASRVLRHLEDGLLMAPRWLKVAASGSSWIQEVPMMASEGLKIASDSCNIALKTYKDLKENMIFVFRLHFGNKELADGLRVCICGLSWPQGC